MRRWTVSNIIASRRFTVVLVFTFTMHCDDNFLPEYKDDVVDVIVVEVFNVVVTKEVGVFVVVVIDVVADVVEVTVFVEFVPVVVVWDVDTLLDELLDETEGIELLTDVEWDQTGWGLTLEVPVDEEDEVTKQPLLLVLLVLELLVELFTDVQLALILVPGFKSATPLEWLVNPGLGAGELEVDVGV